MEQEKGAERKGKERKTRSLENENDKEIERKEKKGEDTGERDS